MASGLQDIPLRRIPDKWDPQWFADFVRDVLRYSDVRNMRVAQQMVLTGQSGEFANLAMADNQTELLQIEQQPALSVIANPTNATATLQAVAASADGQLFGRSGTSLAFLTKSPVITLGTDLTGNVTLTNLGNGTLGATIANDAVSNAKLADMAQSLIKGRASGAGTGDPTDLTATEVATIVATAVASALNVTSGKYTPTLTNVTNLDASSAGEFQYIRIGSIVFVAGRVTADATSAATITELGISLPIASNFGASEDCAGAAFSTGAIQGAGIRADATNDRAAMVYEANATNNQAMYMAFGYEII